MNNFGTSPHKLHRTDDPATSKEAAYAVDSTKLEKMVYDVIAKAGAEGIHSDGIRNTLPSSLPYSSVTARYKALVEKGLIEYTGERRKGDSGRGQRVMRATNRFGTINPTVEGQDSCRYCRAKMDPRSGVCSMCGC
jgi:hypothetical protein